MNKLMLNGLWDLSFTNPIDNQIMHTKIQIPSNVEPKLVELGLIENYMPVDNAYATTKFEAVDDWTYTTIFSAKDLVSGKKQLVFEGIDTIAQVYLNNEKILDCENMHIAYKYDVTAKLKDENELKVIIRSCQLYAQNRPHDIFSAPHGNYGTWDVLSHIRKARHNGGWDNAPRVFTTGIYRPVYIEVLDQNRFEDVYVYTETISEETVTIGAFWQYVSSETDCMQDRMIYTISDENEIVYTYTHEVFFTQGSSHLTIPRDKIELWWPSGFGKAKLYDLKIEIARNGKTVASHTQKLGIRTIELEKTDFVDNDGNGEFVFVVNGEKVFIRGTNWKPLHPLGSTADQLTKSQKALNEIVNLNCNSVRIWGGGIYEDASFFDFCDRNGILVWQDFMFACEVPSTEEWYCRLVAKEAEFVIKKYRNHPSMAIWCGDNEDDECLGWHHRYSQALPSDNTITRKILKDAVVRFDPYRAYIESSPYASDENFAERKKGMLTHHQTETHMYPLFEDYEQELKNTKSIFIGETGPIEINSFTVNERIFELEKNRLQKLWDNNDIPPFEPLHQLDGYMAGLLRCGKNLTKKFFEKEFAFTDWKHHAFAINLLSAELFKDIIEYCRACRWSKSGVIWWSLMDMWPMICNYSVIDCDFNKKLAYHWIKQSQQEFIISAISKEVGGDLRLYVANDTLYTKKAEYTVTAYDKYLNKKQIAKGIWAQDKNSATEIQKLAPSEDAELWIIEWTVDGKVYKNHAFSKKYADYDTMRKWVKIIGEECGFVNEITEL